MIIKIQTEEFAKILLQVVKDTTKGLDTKDKNIEAKIVLINSSGETDSEVFGKAELHIEIK
ncbi:MAG: hypothetical protein AABW93_00630 [Nanoarchaeota archaeon]